MAPYGNVSGKRQKGIYLSKVRMDMLAQLSIVTGKTESAVVEDALWEHYLRIRAEYESGKLNWQKILEEHHYHMPPWQR